MIHIGIIEDDYAFAELLENRIRTDDRFQGDVEVNIYINPGNFIEMLKQGTHFDVCFSDIQMPDMNGLELAKQIRRMNPKIIVVLLTSFTKYVYEGYKVFAFDYLLKADLDNSWDEFAGRLRKEIENREEKVYWIKHANGVERIPVDDIIYISKYRNYSEFIVEGRENFSRERKNMQEVYQELKKFGHFVYVKKGCVINLKKIARMTAKEVKMVNGESISVGRIYIEQLRRKMIQYVDGEI